jgi:hypothetical protein
MVLAVAPHDRLDVDDLGGRDRLERAAEAVGDVAGLTDRHRVVGHGTLLGNVAADTGEGLTEVPAADEHGYRTAAAPRRREVIQVGTQVVFHSAELKDQA